MDAGNSVRIGSGCATVSGYDLSNATGCISGKAKVRPEPRKSGYRSVHTRHLLDGTSNAAQWDFSDKEKDGTSSMNGRCFHVHSARIPQSGFDRNAFRIAPRAGLQLITVLQDTLDRPANEKTTRGDRPPLSDIRIWIVGPTQFFHRYRHRRAA